MKTWRIGGIPHLFLTSLLYYVTSDRLHAPAAITRPYLNIEHITNHVANTVFHLIRDLTQWHTVTIHTAAQNVLWKGEGSYNRRKERSLICAGFNIRCWLCGKAFQAQSVNTDYKHVESIPSHYACNCDIVFWDITDMCRIVSYCTVVLPISRGPFPQTIPLFFTAIGTPD